MLLGSCQCTKPVDLMVLPPIATAEELAST